MHPSSLAATLVSLTANVFTIFEELSIQLQSYVDRPNYNQRERAERHATLRHRVRICRAQMESWKILWGVGEQASGAYYESLWGEEREGEI